MTAAALSLFADASTRLAALAPLAASLVEFVDEVDFELLLADEGLEPLVEDAAFAEGVDLLEELLDDEETLLMTTISGFS